MKKAGADKTNSDSHRLQILVVDDDYYFRTTLSRVLEKEGYEVMLAESGVQAKEVLALQDFNLVITDIKMPGLDGIGLLTWIQTEKRTPVVLMTAFAELEKTLEATKLGAAGFLAKPFKREELLEVIAKSQPQAQAEVKEEAYCKISIDDFISGSEIRYSIFVQLNNQKFVKVAHCGEDMTLERINQYKGRGVRYLFLRTTDYRDYINFNISVSKALEKAEWIDHKRKLEFVRNSTTAVLERLFSPEADEDSFYQAKALVESSVAILGESPDVTNILESLGRHSDFLYAHSVGVSLYSAMIGKKLGWKSPTGVFRLSSAGLLHDIGKKEIPMELLTKARSALTAEEIAMLESHPRRGHDILTSIPSIPGDIPQIALQHHEDCLGFGYPSRVRKDRIHPMARVVAVANDFCSLVIKNPNSPGIPAKEAIRRMLSNSGGRLDEPPLVALLQLFRYASDSDCVAIVKSAKHA